MFQHSEHCLISLCHFPALFHLFLLQSLNPSIHSLSLCPTSDSLYFVAIFQSSCSSSFFSYFSLNFQLFLEYISFLTPSNRSNSPSASDLDFPTPLHFVLPSQVCRQSFVYVNTTSIPKPFSLSLPKARTSSCFIPRWAQGETRKAV